MLTIYRRGRPSASGLDPEAVHDCGATQGPPVAQLLGNLIRVDAPAETERTTTGYAVTLAERAMPKRQDEAHYVVRARGE